MQNLFISARPKKAFYSLNLLLLSFPYGSPRGYGFLILCIDLMSEPFSGWIVCLCTAWQLFVMLWKFMQYQSASLYIRSHSVSILVPIWGYLMKKTPLYSQGNISPCK